MPSHIALPQLAAADPAFIPTIEAYTVAPVGGGNTVDVLLNGDQICPAQLAAIRSARETITYAQYFSEDGPIGREIAEAFADRCRAGVRAHILLDGFGAIQMPAEYRETMTRAGCQVATFRPLSRLSLLAAVGFGRANKRNHRHGCPRRRPGGRIPPGRIRRELTRRDQQRARRRVVLPATAPVGVGLGPDRPELPCGGKLLDVHDVPARHLLGPTIDLHHQSLLPSRHQMTRALIEAPGRGVRVVVLLPGAIDNNIVRQASRSKLGELLKAGIEIYEYQAGLLHAKVMTVDGIGATRSSRRARPGILQPAAGGSTLPVREQL